MPLSIKISNITKTFFFFDLRIKNIQAVKNKYKTHFPNQESLVPLEAKTFPRKNPISCSNWGVELVEQFIATIQGNKVTLEADAIVLLRENKNGNFTAKSLFVSGTL